jgi:catechol 2,3-dioxygenase-like lactoylglutathione lyase family enzyme
MSPAEDRGIDMKLEVIVIPVADVDRAKEFYGRLGWRLDADRSGEDFRLVQFTPPGSGCSVQFGTSLTPAEPGSAQALLLIVPDIDAAHDDLVSRGVAVSAVYHCATGTACRFQDGEGAFQRVSGPAPGHTSYFSFASFSATAGCCKRSRRDCRAASMPPPGRHSPPRQTWRARCAARRPPTGSTRSASARPTRTGPTGTPRTWWPSRPARTCQPDRPGPARPWTGYGRIPASMPSRLP